MPLEARFDELTPCGRRLAVLVRRSHAEQIWMVASRLKDEALFIFLDEWLDGHWKGADLRAVETTAQGEPERGQSSRRRRRRHGMCDAPRLVAQLAQIDGICGLARLLVEGSTDAKTQAAHNTDTVLKYKGAICQRGTRLSGGKGFLTGGCKVWNAKIRQSRSRLFFCSPVAALYFSTQLWRAF